MARQAPEIADRAIDLGERGADKVTALSGAVARHAPEVAEHLRQSVSDATTAATERARSSNLPSRARAAAEVTQEKVSSAVSDGLHKVNEVADRARTS